MGTFKIRKILMESNETIFPRENFVFTRYTSNKVTLEGFYSFKSVDFRKIVKKINSTFEPLEGIKQFINDWNKSYSKTMRKALLDPDNQEFLKELFTSEEEGNLLDMIFNVSQTSNITSENNQFNVTETRERLSVYFEGNFR